MSRRGVRQQTADAFPGENLIHTDLQRFAMFVCNSSPKVSNFAAEVDVHTGQHISHPVPQKLIKCRRVVEKALHPEKCVLTGQRIIQAVLDAQDVNDLNSSPSGWRSRGVSGHRSIPRLPGRRPIDEFFQEVKTTLTTLMDQKHDAGKRPRAGRHGAPGRRRGACHNVRTRSSAR